MMDPREIARLSRKAARDSARNGVVPFIVWPEDLALWKEKIAAGTYPRLPFPALGDRKPRGFKLVREMFVDSSGFGRDSEPATTAEALVMREIKVGFAYSIGDQGQFQVYVNEWQPSPNRMADAHEERSDA